MKTLISFVAALAVLISCTKIDNNIEPTVSSPSIDYFKFQVGEKWELIEVNQIWNRTTTCSKLATKSIALSKKISEGTLLSIGINFMGKDSLIEVRHYNFSKTLKSDESGIEIFLNQPQDLGYKSYSSVSMNQSSNCFFKITSIVPHPYSSRVSGEFVALLNNNETIKGSFRVTIASYIK